MRLAFSLHSVERRTHSQPLSSRVRKIKCLQSAPESRCEACREAKLNCHFRDRERYFEERSRVITGAASTPLPRSQSTHASDATAGSPHHRYHSPESNAAINAFSVGSYSMSPSRYPVAAGEGNMDFSPYANNHRRCVICSSALPSPARF